MLLKSPPAPLFERGEIYGVFVQALISSSWLMTDFGTPGHFMNYQKPVSVKDPPPILEAPFKINYECRALGSDNVKVFI